jgi:hypothetical protein
MEECHAKSMIVCSALVMVVGTAVAGELPKEGKVTGTFYGTGTDRLAPMGKDAFITGWEGTGYTLGGVFDHVTWHCFGGFRAFAGKSSGYTGNCVGTDTAGDQIMISVESTDESPPEAKVRPDKAVALAGTGKYAGIIGSWSGVNHIGEFKTDTTTYVNFVELNGSYKLP